jgi:hypothetical protein
MDRWRIVAVLVLIVLGSLTAPRTAIPQRSALDKAMDEKLWRDLQQSPANVDKCAVPLALDRTLDTLRDWPAYCNRFRDRDIITTRVSELRAIFEKLDLSPEQREQVRTGKVWVSAPAAVAEVAWGRPRRVNQTMTAAGTREQWLYGDGQYVYIENGIITAVQTSR